MPLFRASGRGPTPAVPRAPDRRLQVLLVNAGRTGLSCHCSMHCLPARCARPAVHVLWLASHAHETQRWGAGDPTPRMGRGPLLQPSGSDPATHA
eukprot:scaffold10269_cov102-Isochrysis_galbana.AAC.3